MYNIKTLNKISPNGLDVFDRNKYRIGDDVEDPNGILVRSAAMHEMELPESLLAVARAGAGVNNIPIDRCSEQGIVVFNTPGANANAVKELVVCALLMSARKIYPSMVWTQSLKGQGGEVGKLVEKGKSQFVGPELAGKSLGVIGLARSAPASPTSPATSTWRCGATTPTCRSRTRGRLPQHQAR